MSQNELRMLTFVKRTESSLKEPTINLSILGVWEPHLDRRPLRLAGSSSEPFLLSLPTLVLHVFRCFRKIAQRDYELRLVFLRLFTWNKSAATGQIIMKFDI